MAIKFNKSTIIDQFAKKEGDTGSMAVQIAILTDRINRLTGHFKVNAKDYASKTGLMKMVGRRKRFLDYVQRYNSEEYKSLIERLGLRK